ncbi:type-1 angiotensin II receptor-associated protein isoform X2 [Ictalurus furcatus]|uniref:type-1 angiotensin II receptor-associated protein isoform X2 n=1 Tax=Ictalurus furcatus TaxID=66913 RepID=UPI00235001E2|nr:type-1 angiotensin II receptor-associated protein isoform X2 [Ictalurus furcatus]
MPLSHVCCFPPVTGRGHAQLFFSCTITNFKALKFTLFLLLLLLFFFKQTKKKHHKLEVDTAKLEFKMEIPPINLKAILVVHWLLTVWGCMAWLPSSYICANFSVLAVGVWAMAQRDSVDAVLMFLIGLLLTIVIDIVHFSVFYSVYPAGDLFRFSTGMAIFSLILKPFSCFFVYQMYRERGGEYNINFDLETSVDSRCTTDSTDTTFLGRRY